MSDKENTRSECAVRIAVRERPFSAEEKKAGVLHGIENYDRPLEGTYDGDLPRDDPKPVSKSATILLLLRKINRLLTKRTIKFLYFVYPDLNLPKNNLNPVLSAHSTF